MSASTTVPSSTVTESVPPYIAHAQPAPTGPPINYTSLGPIGPGVAFGYPIPLNKTTVCSGNLLNLSIECCQSAGGTIDLAEVYCDAECCQYGFYNKSMCTPGAYISYPYCVLPPSKSMSDWKACYDGGTSQALDNITGFATGVSQCEYPHRSSSPRAVSAAGVVVLASTLVAAVLAAV